MSVNKVILIGNLGRDPETRYLDSNRVVTTFSLATSETFTDRNGERKTDTEWHRIEMWDNLAKIAEKYLRKGSQVYIEGRLRTRKWQDKEGRDRYTTEIVGSEMQMLGGRGGAGGGASGGSGGGYSDAGSRSETSENLSAGAGAGASHQEFDDDIPF